MRESGYMKESTYLGLINRIALILQGGLLVGIVSQLTTGVHAEETQLVFRAGAATSNITPPLGELIVGGWQAYPATSVHDELHARCLVLDDGRAKLAIVLCDNVGIPVEVFDLAKQQLQDTIDLPPSHALRASTHTHSAVSARSPSEQVRGRELSDYQKFLARRISDGVRRAVANLEPAQIAWGGIFCSGTCQEFWFQSKVERPKVLATSAAA